MSKHHFLVALTASFILTSLNSQAQKAKTPVKTKLPTTADQIKDIPSIPEVTITSCTIQHSSNYSDVKGKYSAIGGANIRILGKKSWPINSITGNVISDTTISNCRVSRSLDGAIDLSIPSDNKNITLSGNSFSSKTEIAPAALASK